MFGIMTKAGKMCKRFKERRYSFHCPVCDHRVKEFLPLPDFYHEEAESHGCPYSYDDFETLNYEQYSCPHCASSDRERLYALYLREKAGSNNNKRTEYIIEFAPSQSLGHMIKSLGAFKLRTADLFMEGVDDRVNLEDMLIYPDSSFDGFICSHVLEHVPDDKKALRELQRILKPGGWGILMVPVLLSITEIDECPDVTDEGERWRRFGQNDHVRMYSRKGFLQRIEDAGFSVAQYGWQQFDNKVFTEAGITRKSVLYVVGKADRPLLPQVVGEGRS